MKSSGTANTSPESVLWAEFEAVCANNPVAVMVLGQHYLDESGQCAECRDIADAHIAGDNLETVHADWPCTTAYAVRHAVLGWTYEQVQSVEFQSHQQIAKAAREDRRPLDGHDFNETLARREAWVTSGIPAHRAILYTTANISLDEARTHEASDLTSDELDESLNTLVALL